MADPVAKARRSRAKDLRQGINKEAPPRRAKKKKPAKRPWKVMAKMPRPRGRPLVITIHESTTEEAAQQWVAKEKRSYDIGDGDYWLEYRP